MLDHPVTQKVLATIVAAGVIATGGVAWNTKELATKHEHDITQLRASQRDLVEEFRESNSTLTTEVGQVGKDVAEIKTGVAVLKERTERLDAEYARKLRP